MSKLLATNRRTSGVEGRLNLFLIRPGRRRSEGLGTLRSREMKCVDGGSCQCEGREGAVSREQVEQKVAPEVPTSAEEVRMEGKVEGS